MESVTDGGRAPASAPAAQGPSAERSSPDQAAPAAPGPSAERSSETLRQLVRLGMDELVALARAGKLRPGHVGVAVKGGRRYHEAIKRGDVASEAERAKRAAICGRCEHRRWREVEIDDLKAIASYCGDPFVDRGRGQPCGCLVMVTVAGDVVSDHAAGKAMVASERCPLKRARW